MTPFLVGPHHNQEASSVLVWAFAYLAPAGSCRTSSSNTVFPCVLVQVPLYQPGRPLGDTGLLSAVWPCPLLHLQGL